MLSQLCYIVYTKHHSNWEQLYFPPSTAYVFAPSDFLLYSWTTTQQIENFPVPVSPTNKLAFIMKVHSQTQASLHQNNQSPTSRCLASCTSTNQAPPFPLSRAKHRKGWGAVLPPPFHMSPMPLLQLELERREQHKTHICAT